MTAPSSSHIACIERRKTDKDPRRLTLLVLLADTPVPAVLEKYGDYHDVFTSLFRNSATSLPEDVDDFVLTIKSYDVVNEPWEYPSATDLDEAAGLLITGSAASAYEDKPWINRLVDFTASLPPSYPNLKIVGICYGHQIIARAFGGKVEKNAKGWELGVRTVELTGLGKSLMQGSEATASGSMPIHQVHQDHVPDLPPDFALLGSTPVCKVQGMVSPASAAKLSDIHIFCLQGHPEFSPELVKQIIEVREKKGILTKDFADESRINAKLHDDGVKIGATILRLLSI